MNAPLPTRRPEVPRLAVQLQRQHPSWDAARCLVEAKARATQKSTTRERTKKPATQLALELPQ